MPQEKKFYNKRKAKLLGELERIISEIKELDIEKAILFGSIASGDMHNLSDIDLIIIKKTKKRFLERLDEFYSYLKPRCAIDILVYTPEEFSCLVKTNNFIKGAAKSGKVVYEKAKKDSRGT